MSKISIIVPVYNVENYISECIQSILNQTYQDFELICVNDGSADKSVEILESFKLKDSRINVVTQKNKGVSSARNRGVALAKGEYIAFIDSDDKIHPKYLEVLYENLLKYEADISICQMGKLKKNKKIKQSKDVIKVYHQPLKSMLTKDKNRVKYVVTCALFKKELIKNHAFIEGIYYEDYPWVIALMSKQPKVVSTRQKLYYYTINPNSIMHSRFTNKKIQSYRTGLAYLEELFRFDKQNRRFLKNRVVPNILKTEFQMLELSEDMLLLKESFKQELNWLKESNLLSLWHIGLLRYLKYKKIMQ